MLSGRIGTGEKRGENAVKKPVIGVNVPSSATMGSLEGELGRIAADGWDAAELNLAACPFILGGRLQQPAVDYVRSLFEKFSLHYTAHVCYGLDLRSPDELHRRVLDASVRVCAALGIDRLNLHFEEFSHDRAKEARWLERVREGADLAAGLGVALNVENVEVEDVRYALEAVEALDHPNVGMTLDLGHLWLSANWFHYDFLEAVKACAPRVRHVHVNDNGGVFEPMRLTDYHLYNTLGKGYRFTFDRGDVHVAPFWGTAPLKEAFSVLKSAGFDGIWLCEYYSQLFHPLNGDIRRRVLEEIENA